MTKQQICSYPVRNFRKCVSSKNSTYGTFQISAMPFLGYLTPLQHQFSTNEKWKNKNKRRVPSFLIVDIDILSVKMQSASDEIPFPLGWERKIDATTGRWYVNTGLEKLANYN